MTTISWPWSAPRRDRPALFTSIRDRLSEVTDRAARAQSDLFDDALTARECAGLRHRWLTVAERTGLGRPVSTPLGGVHVGRLPFPTKIVPSTYGRPGYMIVSLPFGVLVEDLEQRRAELASGLGVYGVRFSRRGPDHVRVDLVDHDPLAVLIEYPLPVPLGHVGFGVDEVGSVVSRALSDLTHIGVQGSTGGGKSAFAYGLLAQLHAFGPLVDIVGLDPTGKVLRPLGEHPQGLRAWGTRDAAERYPSVLRCLVDGMDRRIENLSLRADCIEITPRTPLQLVVVEELGAVSRLTGYSTSKPSETQRLLGRIAAEGRKAGVKLLVVGQRLGSDVLETATRDQLNTRLTFGCRDLGTLRMLSPDAGPEDLAELADAPAGVALMEMAGVSGLTRVRAPWLPYSRYVDLVAGPGEASAAA